MDEKTISELRFLCEDMFQLIPDPNQLDYMPVMKRLGLDTRGIEEEAWYKQLEEWGLAESMALHNEISQLKKTVESEHALRVAAEHQLAEFKAMLVSLRKGDWNTRAERTCCKDNINEDEWFVCSECGCQCQGDQYGETSNYCANCGARVVS